MSQTKPSINVIITLCNLSLFSHGYNCSYQVDGLDCNGLSGTRNGRVLDYINETDTLKQTAEAHGEPSVTV